MTDYYYGLPMMEPSSVLLLAPDSVSVVPYWVPHSEKHWDHLWVLKRVLKGVTSDHCWEHQLDWLEQRLSEMMMVLQSAIGSESIVDCCLAPRSVRHLPEVVHQRAVTP